MNLKKIITSILLLVMLFALCACEGVTKIANVELPPLPDVDSTPTPAPTETPEPTAAPEHERISAYIKHVREESYDPAGGDKLILSFAYDTVDFHMEGRDSAAAAVNEYMARLSETYYTGNDYGVGSSVGKSRLLELAEDNYRYAYENNALDMDLEYSSSRTADITRADDSVISLLLTDNVYTGGAHGDSSRTGCVFDSETGSLLTLDKLAADAEGFKQFLSEQLLTMSKQEEINSLIDVQLVPDDVRADKLSALLRDGSWYFNSDGMVIFSAQEELSLYESGIVEFKIPYSELKGHMDDQWLPAERADGGKLSVKALEDIEDGSMEIADRIVVDEAGRQFCLIAEGPVYDLKLSTVEYSDRFYETQRLWYCSELSDCAVQVVTVIPEGMPDLMVSFRSADGSLVRKFISESGLDGSVVLVDDDIEAVG